MFQFPRCPPESKDSGARPCAGRVAPFGDPRITGCQRLPRAFRRVAASFIGRRRQGIHHAPIIRNPTVPLQVVPTPSGCQQTAPDRLAPERRRRPRHLARLVRHRSRTTIGRLGGPIPLPVLPGAYAPPSRSWGFYGTAKAMTGRTHSFIGVSHVQCARATGHQRVPTPGCPEASVSHGRKIQRISRGELSKCIDGQRPSAGQTQKQRSPGTAESLPIPPIPRVEPRGFEPRTSAVQGRRSPG